MHGRAVVPREAHRVVQGARDVDFERALGPPRTSDAVILGARTRGAISISAESLERQLRVGALLAHHLARQRGRARALRAAPREQARVLLLDVRVEARHGLERRRKVGPCV